MTWILTRSRKHFDYVNPQAATISMIDITSGLANECRYAGQCSSFYSVAQHSVLASYLVSEACALEALMHDAAEAYCKDIPRPMKELLPDYKRIERRVDLAIRVRYQLPPECSEEVKHADLVMLATERRDLLPADDTPWLLLKDITPSPSRIEPWTPEVSYARFWQRFSELIFTTGRTDVL